MCNYLWSPELSNFSGNWTYRQLSPGVERLVWVRERIPNTLQKQQASYPVSHVSSPNTHSLKYHFYLSKLWRKRILRILLWGATFVKTESSVTLPWVQILCFKTYLTAATIELTICLSWIWKVGTTDSWPQIMPTSPDGNYSIRGRYTGSWYDRVNSYHRKCMTFFIHSLALSFTSASNLNTTPNVSLFLIIT